MHRSSMTDSSVALPGIWRRLPLRRRARAALRVPALVREERLLFAMVTFTAVAFATYSCLLHMHYGSFAYDLGIFDQEFWHWSRFETPRSTITGVPNELGDHFNPILLLLVPLYWVWSDPQVLLIAQGVLLGASMVPIFLFARDRVGRTPAYLLTAAYGLFWAVHTAVAFNFHEVAFAPLIIGLIVLAIDRRAWGKYFLLIGALLLVKENMALLVAAFGVYLLFFRAYRQAAMTFALGVAWYFVTTEVVIPLLADGAFRHWSYIQFGADLNEAVHNIIDDPLKVFEVLVTPDDKVTTMLYLFVPFLCLTLFSPMAVLCVPLIFERMLAFNPNFWHTDMHYSLVIAPIIVLGAADGLARLIRMLRAHRRARHIAIACAGAALAANGAIATQFQLSSLADPSFYVKSDEDRVVDRALSLIPPDASVTAWTKYVPHLSQRDDIYELRGPGTREGEYIVAHAGNWFKARFPHAGYVDHGFLVYGYHRRYQPIFWEGNIVVMKRRRSAGPAASGGSTDVSKEGLDLLRRARGADD